MIQVNKLSPAGGDGKHPLSTIHCIVTSRGLTQLCVVVNCHSRSQSVY